MCDSTQVKCSGAINGTITAESANPRTQNKHTTFKSVETSGE